jgi:hypothetical protein
MYHQTGYQDLQRRAIQIAVFVFTALVLLSALFEGGPIYDFCFPDDSQQQVDSF